MTLVKTNASAIPIHWKSPSEGISERHEKSLPTVSKCTSFPSSPPPPRDYEPPEQGSRKVPEIYDQVQPSTPSMNFFSSLMISVTFSYMAVQIKAAHAFGR